ncbi:hypothetical protein [Nannocystis punicea]|uniref:Myxococcus cysteine-rich repeat-containing protein n=1 Tax=Nannocystis punicea TaxID=2995304 RepID=A0ABY7GT22_9BACT|nr:hypothetical protein [Nannocystis poenicansa]WAS90076.1 hypothetical protein O0S08_28105 [Nannocystis poenicansa]
MRTLGLLAALLFLVDCGPKAPGEDTGGSDTGPSTTVDDPPASTSTTATSGTGVTTETGPDTTGDTSVGGLCFGQEAGHVWTCQCTSVLGPWTPFNDACDKFEGGAVDWAEWLCETYADEEPSTGAETTDGTTGGVLPDNPTTGDPTGSLGCDCTCRITEECCDDSKP